MILKFILAQFYVLHFNTISISDVTDVPVYSRLKQDYIDFFLQAPLKLLRKLAFKIWCHFV